MKTKRILAAVLGLALAVGMSTTAFAAGGSKVLKDGDIPGDLTPAIDVVGAYSGDGEVADVYNVKIVWGEMTFTYKTTGDKTWDAEDHTYNVNEGDEWVAEGNTVTVYNHSNVPVDVEFAFTPDDSTFKGKYTGELDVTKKTLAAGIEGKPSDADTDSVVSTLTLKGQLNVVEKAQKKLGEVTVTLKPGTVVEP